MHYRSKEINSCGKKIGDAVKCERIKIESSAFSHLEILILGPCFSYRPRGNEEEMLYLVRMETISLPNSYQPISRIPPIYIRKLLEIYIKLYLFKAHI